AEPDTDTASGDARLRRDDVVVNSTGTGTLGRAGYIGDDTLSEETVVIADGHVTIVRVDEQIALPRFLWYVLSTDAFNDFSNTCLAVGATNQMELGREEIRQLGVALPSIAEQRRLVDYLDGEIAEIEEVAAEQRQLVVQLEARLANARQLLLLGADGTGESGWEFGHLKRFVQIARGRFTHRPRNDPALYDGPYPFIQTGDIANAADGVVSTYSQTLNERGLAASRMATAGTVVMAIAANIGDVATLGFDCCFPDSVVALAPGPAMDATYLLELVRALKEELIATSTLNTQLNTNVDRIGSIHVPVPPLPRQHELTRELEAMRQHVSAIRSEAAVDIALLREHREALVCTAVSGGLGAEQGVA
ncbi:MAG: restriction endonuclease subunit S, partial [Candidatus Dormiibacterota bacterium]